MLTRIHLQLEKLISKNYYLHQSAKDGYRSYLQAYASYSLKKIFDINKLDLRKVGKAYGFAIPPKVCMWSYLSWKHAHKSNSSGEHLGRNVSQGG